MFRHPAWAVGSYTVVAACQLPKLSELSQREVFFKEMGHPVPDDDVLIYCRFKIKYLPSWAIYLLLLAIWPIYPLLFMLCLLIEYFVFN